MKRNIPGSNPGERSRGASGFRTLVPSPVDCLSSDVRKVATLDRNNTRLVLQTGPLGWDTGCQLLAAVRLSPACLARSR